VGKKRSVRLHIAGPARRDIAAILKWSLNEFGEAAALRYSALIRQALTDIEADPVRPGSKERPEIMIPGARTYHLDFSRSSVTGARVKDPRHFLLYRQREAGVIEVARLLHDSRDLHRHLPQDCLSGATEG
jgi:toxin ParE1/3/4